MSAYRPASHPQSRRSLAGSLRLFAACIVMLFAVQPHLTAMARPGAHDMAAAALGSPRSDGHPVPCPESGEQQAQAGLSCCAAWSCGLLERPAPPPGASIGRLGYRIAAVALPTPAGVTTEPGERPPRD